MGKLPQPVTYLDVEVNDACKKSGFNLSELNPEHWGDMRALYLVHKVDSRKEILRVMQVYYENKDVPNW